MYQATDVFSDETRAAIIALAARYQHVTKPDHSLDQDQYRGYPPQVTSWPEHQNQAFTAKTTSYPLTCPQAPVSPPPKRRRINYSKYQEELLHAIIARVRYPNTMQKQVIAKRVGISRHQVKVWFQNRRRKDVISGKKESGGDSPGSSSDDPETRAPSVVPASVLHSILDEMNYYGADDFKSSKNARRKMADHRHKPYTAVSPPTNHGFAQDSDRHNDRGFTQQPCPFPNEDRLSPSYFPQFGHSTYQDDAAFSSSPVNLRGSFYPASAQNFDPITSQAGYTDKAFTMPLSNQIAPFHPNYMSAAHDPNMQLYRH